MINDLTSDVLSIDCAAVSAEIEASLREITFDRLKRRGAVVGMSGGIDSSVVAALCVRALGRNRVLGVFMPERDSADETLTLSRLAAESQGIETVLEEITEVLEAAGCYERRDDAIKSVIPEYNSSWKSKIVLPSVVDGDQYRIYSVVAIAPDNRQIRKRLTPAAYLTIVAATNFKQRSRKMLEYFHADRLNYAVAGTPNRLEYDQGFFVKGGDGLADVKPIAHLYKTQVYQLAEYLGIPAEIRNRPPTTDTYSMPQGQDEFYFSLPFEQMDLCLYAVNNGLPAEAVADATGLEPHQIERVFRDITNKRRTTQYLHLAPQLVAPVTEILHAREGRQPGPSPRDVRLSGNGDASAQRRPVDQKAY